MLAGEEQRAALDDDLLTLRRNHPRHGQAKLMVSTEAGRVAADRRVIVLNDGSVLVVTASLEGVHIVHERSELAQRSAGARSKLADRRYVTYRAHLQHLRVTKASTAAPMNGSWSRSYSASEAISYALGSRVRRTSASRPRSHHGRNSGSQFSHQRTKRP